MPKKPVMGTAWFALTREERWMVSAIVGLALLGLTARYLHLRGRTAEPVETPGMEAAPNRGAQE